MEYSPHASRGSSPFRPAVPPPLPAAGPAAVPAAVPAVLPAVLPNNERLAPLGVPDMVRRHGTPTVTAS